MRDKSLYVKYGNGEWKELGNLEGPQGPTGASGASVTIKGTLESIEELKNVKAEIGDGYLINGFLHVYTESGWEDVGNIQGPAGITPDFEVRDKSLYVKYGDGEWENIGIIEGPQGPTGASGASAYDIWIAEGYSGSTTDFINSLKGDKGALDEEQILSLKNELYTSSTSYTNIEINKIMGNDSGSNKTIRSIASDEVSKGVAKVVSGAPDSFNTLKEIADWIGNGSGTTAAQIVTDIESLKNSAHTHANKIVIDNITSDDISSWNNKLGKSEKAESAKVADSANSITWEKVNGKPSAFTPTSHEHSASSITTGVFDIERIPTNIKVKSAVTADSAIKDGNSNNIVDTYATKNSIPTSATVSNWGFTKNAGTVTEVKISASNGITYNSGSVTTNGTLTVMGVTAAQSAIGVSKLVTGDLSGKTYADGMAASQAHTHSQYSLSGHNHDDRYYTETEINTKLAAKQDTINDLGTIRDNASNGATAYSWGNHADAGYLTGYTEQYKGTITGIKMNGESKGTSGVVDLGTVLTSTAITVSGSIISTSASTAESAITSVSATTSNKAQTVYTEVKSNEGICYLIGVSDENDTYSTLYKNINVYMENGSLYASSDERLKDFVKDIDVDLDILSKLPKKYFTWKNDEAKQLQIGTSAQKVYEIYPELISEDKEGKLAVSYEKLSVVALAAVDKLYEENKELKERLKKIEEHLGL